MSFRIRKQVFFLSDHHVKRREAAAGCPLWKTRLLEWNEIKTKFFFEDTNNTRKRSNIMFIFLFDLLPTGTGRSRERKLQSPLGLQNKVYTESPSRRCGNTFRHRTRSMMFVFMLIPVCSAQAPPTDEQRTAVVTVSLYNKMHAIDLFIHQLHWCRPFKMCLCKDE